jgi:MbtH protein
VAGRRLTPYEKGFFGRETPYSFIPGAPMSPDNQQNAEIYKVIINDEEQYSVWPADRASASGWRDAGKSGTKEECLAFIKTVWTDMRPHSVREKMDEDSIKQD